MTRQERLNLLKQDVSLWNKWRKENSVTKINLRHINLIESDLRGADLRGANLTKTDLSGADLRGANLYEASLINADLIKADLSFAILKEANLSGANLTNADLGTTDLSGAKLIRANLSGAILWGTNLNITEFSAALMSATIFIDTDLSSSEGLETVVHHHASTLGTDALLHSKGKIPEVFLRGCGLSDWEIEASKLYNPELDNEERNRILYRIYDLQAKQPVQISPLFISYSHADSAFVDRVEKSLNNKGIRFWRDIHHATAGKLENQIDRAIRHNPTVLVILSKNSIGSDWVEHEVNLARKIEKETRRDVLCPIALDDSWKTSPWSEVIMEQVKKYNILDFSEWEDDTMFEKMFVRLIDGLNLFYKKEED